MYELLQLISGLKSYSLYLTILVVLITISSACQPPQPSLPASTATPFSLAKMELHRNQRKWQDAQISHYRFRMFRVCICEGNKDVLIEVEKEQIVSLKYQSSRAMTNTTVPTLRTWEQWSVSSQRWKGSWTEIR